MIKYIKGDLFNSNYQTLVCTVNCEGVMGKGIALKFKNRFPRMYSAYRGVCLYGDQLKQGGDLWLFSYPEIDQLTLWTPTENGDQLIQSRHSQVLCFATKEKWRNPSKLEWIERGLQKMKDIISKGNIRSIAFPKLGCSNGGLNWLDVKPLMEEYLNKLDIPVEIYI